MSPRRAPLALAVLCALVLAGCASAPSAGPQPLPQEAYLHAIEDATAVYETTRQAVHRAHADGLITDEQHERIGKLGRKAEGALRAASDALDAWLALGGVVEPADLDNALLAMRRAVADVAAAWGGMRR